MCAGLTGPNASPFRLRGPSNNPLFLPIFMFSPDLNLLDLGSDKKKFIMSKKDPELFCAGSLHLVSFERFNF